MFWFEHRILTSIVSTALESRNVGGNLNTLLKLDLFFIILPYQLLLFLVIAAEYCNPESRVCCSRSYFKAQI